MLFYIGCYTPTLIVDSKSRNIYLAGQDELVGYMAIDEDGHVAISDENRIVFQNGCEAIAAISELESGGEDLHYRPVPYRTSHPTFETAS